MVQMNWFGCMMPINVRYFNPEHTTRFIASVVILTAGGLFTVLWFPHFSKLKIMKWTKNTK